MLTQSQPTATSSRLRVDSEIGTLRRVILHRPDLELRRLTPATARRCCSTTSCGSSARGRSTTRSPTR